VRPSADRVREALFARLGDLAGARVLDLYAGSGALGIEALSRGAERAVFVERSRRVLDTLRGNVTTLGLDDRSRVLPADAASACRRLAAEGLRFELVLADPPYASGEAARALRALAECGLVAPGGTVVVESGRRHPVPDVAGFARRDERRYGDTVLARFEPEGAGKGRSDSDMAGRVALFPASFDPVTNGHLDIVDRALRVFEELVLGVARNVAKEGLFSLEDRMEMLETATGGHERVRITSFDSLTVDFAREIGACAVLRGFRAMSDFEYEFEMALMNKHLNPDVETVFMMSSQKYLYVSSSRLKELVRFGQDVSEFVPPLVAKRLRERLERD